jgi:hypothetical protein
MSIVRENINFERGQDPIKSMGIGASRTIQGLKGIYLQLLKDLKTTRIKNKHGETTLNSSFGSAILKAIPQSLKINMDGETSTKC